jgi:hypothetical protein
MVEIKTHRDHPSSMEERIRNRGKNSGGEEGYTVHTGGDAPNRVFHNVHEKGNVQQRGDDVPGQDIFGDKRGPANPRGQY